MSDAVHEHDWPEVPPVGEYEFPLAVVLVCHGCRASKTIPGSNRPRVQSYVPDEDDVEWARQATRQDRP